MKMKLNRISKALSDVTRREIVSILLDGEMSTADIELVVNGGKGIVLRHVDLLEEAGIVCTRREGRRRIVQLADQPFKPLLDWIDSINNAKSETACA